MKAEKSPPFNAILKLTMVPIHSCEQDTFGTFILDIRYEVATLLAKSKKKNLSTRVHPEALDAFNFFHSMVFKFDKVQVGLEAINAIQCDQIYRAVLSKPDQLELISGFEFFSFSLQHFVSAYLNPPTNKSAF